MATITIVTPWLNGGHGPDSLLPDYAAAVQGAHEVVSVDNGSAEETAQALRKAGGTYIRNEQNVGFAAANNQGYSASTGDVVVFLNSDVAGDARFVQAVLADVRDGALYGPSLGYQLVAGRHIPYLEGWCIAATRATWGHIYDALYLRGQTPPGGPWDHDTFKGPYWEDNDLCFRAALAGIPLIQTAWPIAHKGGRTAGPIVTHARSFAQNEHTFTERVLQAFGEDAPAMTPMYQKYLAHLAQPSDIQHHLPLLYSLARGNVLELGTRSGVSTAALLAGVEKRGGQVTSVDLADCSRLYDGHPSWAFIQGNSLDPEIAHSVSVDVEGNPNPIDVLLIDTEHTLSQASAELALYGDRMAPGSFILMHDPETFPGVRRAAREFAQARGWPLTIVLPNNGMAVIEVPR